LTNRHRNLIFIWEYGSLLAVKEREGRSRLKGTGTLDFERDEREKNGTVFYPPTQKTTGFARG
jgi:hypothetical protein